MKRPTRVSTCPPPPAISRMGSWGRFVLTSDLGANPRGERHRGIVGTSLPLKRAGANFVALCPFHKEKTPSFNVNPHRQIFYCFGCHKGGDVFAFVKDFENVDFPEAVRRLAERAKIPLEFEQRRRGAPVAAHE